MSENIVDQPDKIAFRDELGSSVCWASIDDDYTDEAKAHKVTFDAAGYEYVKNGSDDWFHTDGDLYQGSTLMRVIRRKSDGKLFGFSYWEGGGKVRRNHDRTQRRRPWIPGQVRLGRRR